LDVGRFNLRKLNELEGRKQYQTEITNGFAALENFSGSEDIKRAWQNIKEYRNLRSRESRSERIEAAYTVV